MPNALKSLIFATVLCVVCSLLLTAASTGLQSFQQKNAEVESTKKHSCSPSASSRTASPVTSAQIEKLYHDKVKSLVVDESGRARFPKISAARRTCRSMSTLRMTSCRPTSCPSTPGGCGGKIHGYLAIENDGATIRGFTVYKHQETPGLGGEIESRWFRKNFKGKKIVNSGGDFVSIKIAKGSAEGSVTADRQINLRGRHQRRHHDRQNSSAKG